MFRLTLGPVLSWLRREVADPISSVALAVPGATVRSLPSSADRQWGSPVFFDHAILDEVRRKSLQSARPLGMVLSSRACRYQFDEQIFDRPPFGMSGTHLRVETQSWVIPNSIVQPIAETLALFDLTLGVLAPRAAAAAEATFLPPERSGGRCGDILVIDIGYRSTDVAAYRAGELTELFSVSYGYDTIIAGLAATFNVSESIAERIDLEEMFRSAAGQPIVKRARAILQAREGLIFSAVKQRLESLDSSWDICSGAVLTGHGALVPEVVLSARDRLGIPVRLGIPSIAGSASIDLDADAAAALGVALVQARAMGAEWRDSIDQDGVDQTIDSVRTALANGGRRGRVRPALSRWLREFLPEDDAT